MNFLEEDFRQLAQNLHAEWESIATDLGFNKSQIDHFWSTGSDHGIEYVLFDILMTWQESQPQVINFRKALGQVLKNAGRGDLANHFCCFETSAGMYI